MPNAILLSDDLMFASRIAGTARDLGLSLNSARSPTALLEAARRQPPTCVIVDLANNGLDLPVLMTELKKLPNPPRVVAYGSHVDAASLQAARAAGCAAVLPRSKFVEELPTSLPLWFAPTGAANHDG
jgi:CheY-like chemotaxis protein